MSPNAIRIERLALTDDQDGDPSYVEVEYRPLMGRGDKCKMHYFMLMHNGERIATLTQRRKPDGKIRITELRARVARVFGASEAKLVAVV